MVLTMNNFDKLELRVVSLINHLILKTLHDDFIDLYYRRI